MSAENFDIVVRRVPGHGWLGLLVSDGVEHYRTGDFRPDPAAALVACLLMAERLGLLT